MIYLKIFFTLFFIFSIDLFAFSVGVFCSADDKIAEYYKKEAFILGSELASCGIQLITGGSRTGLMKAVIDGYYFVKKDHFVYGIMPKILKEFDVCHPLLKETNVIWTDSISQRLDLFIMQCDHVIILPGGWGTLHELMNFLVHQQFGYCTKKIILFDSSNYWTHLLIQFKHMIKAGTLSEKHLDQLIVVSSIKDLFSQLNSNGTYSNGLLDRFWEINIQIDNAIVK